MKLIAKNGIPLYCRVKEGILKNVETNAWAKGSKIPSEFDLAKQFDVSRETIRRAISDLVFEGILERRHGYGTFVVDNSASMEGDLSQIHFSGELGDSHQLISFRIMEANRSIASGLMLPLNEQVTEIVRLRYFQDDDVPSILSKSYFRAGRFLGIEKEDLTKRLYDIIEQKYNTPLFHAKTLVEPVLLTEQEANYLQVKPKTLALMLSRTCYTANDEAVVLSKSFFRSDKCKMLIET